MGNNTLDLNVELGPQFTLEVVNKSGPEGVSTLQLEYAEDVTPMTLEAGVKSSSLFQNNPGNGGGSGTTFLPVSDNLDETDPTYFYFGWISVDGGWLIHRQERSSSLTSKATVSNNPGVLDLSTAWPDRLTLTYGA